MALLGVLGTRGGVRNRKEFGTGIYPPKHDFSDLEQEFTIMRNQEEICSEHSQASVEEILNPGVELVQNPGEQASRLTIRMESQQAGEVESSGIPSRSAGRIETGSVEPREAGALESRGAGTIEARRDETSEVESWGPGAIEPSRVGSKRASEIRTRGV